MCAVRRNVARYRTVIFRLESFPSELGKLTKVVKIFEFHKRGVVFQAATVPERL